MSTVAAQKPQKSKPKGRNQRAATKGLNEAIDQRAETLERNQRPKPSGPGLVNLNNLNQCESRMVTGTVLPLFPREEMHLD